MKRLIMIGLAVLLLAGLALAGHATLIEPDRLVTRRLDLASPHWPAGRAPLRIVAISDLHAGAPHIDAGKIAEIVRRIGAEAPDVILLLGDYVIHGVIGGTFMAPETLAALLAPLRARHGVVAVLGNHDWWLDGVRVRAALEGQGITVLENAAVALGEGEERFHVAGLADDTTRTPNGRAALEEVPEEAPVIMAMHNPAAIEVVPRRVALSLAGHTHGGQIYLPWLFDPVVPGRAGPDLAHGLIRRDGKPIYVTGGIGTSILPVRLNMPPEITVLTLSHGLE